MALRRLALLTVLIAGAAHAELSGSVFVGSPYGALIGCDYYRNGCGAPVGLGVRGTVGLPWRLKLELGIDVDALVTSRPSLAITPTLGLWRPLRLTDSVDLYPLVSVGVALLPSGFDVAVPYYDAGLGVLWRLGPSIQLRGELTFRGLRVGVRFD